MRRAGPATLFVARVLLAAAMALPGWHSARAEESAGKPWVAGPYSFSDELGGFTILGVEGKGTRDDPFTIRQELHSASPVTMVIRAVGPVRPFGAAGESANGFLQMRILVRNASALAWIEFEFELQEILEEPSLFGDGLSFDQRRTESENIASASFSRYSRDFEPYDRLLFTEGSIDPGETGDFRFLVTDFTPRRTFYLIEDPRIPSS